MQGRQERKFTMVERKAIESLIRSEKEKLDVEVEKFNKTKGDDKKAMPPESLHALEREVRYLISLAEEAAKQSAESKIKDMSVSLIKEEKKLTTKK